jgi:hypothetical protein
MLSQQCQRHINACQKGGKILRGRLPSAHMTDRHQRRFWKSQLTATEIQGLSLPVRQRSLDCGRDFVTHLLAVPMSFDQTRVSQNTEMMGGMGLRAFQFLHKIHHAFFTDEQGLQDTQPRFLAQGLEHRGALAWSQHLAA